MNRFFGVLFFLLFLVEGIFGQNQDLMGLASLADAGGSSWERCPSENDIEEARQYIINYEGTLQVSKIIIYNYNNEDSYIKMFSTVNAKDYSLVSYTLVYIKSIDRFGFSPYVDDQQVNLNTAYENFIQNIKNDDELEFGFGSYCNNESSTQTTTTTSDYESENDEEDSGLWKVVIGAAALGAAIIAIRKRLKNSKKKKGEKEKFKYILQLGDESFTLVENEPQFLYIQAWKITEKGKFPTKASIRIQNSEKALSILPSIGIGRLKSKLLLKGKPSNEEFSITVNASIGNKSIQKIVKIKTGGENKIIVKTFPDNKRSLRPNIDQTLPCYAQVVGSDDKPIDELTKKIKFNPNQSKWIDLSDPIIDDGWIAINIGASDPNAIAAVSHPPKSVILGITMEDVKKDEPILQNNLEIQLLDCMLETNLEDITFPISEEKSQIICKAFIENCDGETPWKFKAIYMKNFDTPDNEPLTEIEIEDVSETKVNITLTGPILEPKEGEKFLRKLFVISAQQKEEKALERHIYVMVSKEGLFIEKGVGENNEINVVAKGNFKKDLVFSLNVYNKETDQIEPHAEGLKNLVFELISNDEISKNIDQVLQADLLFENIYGTMKHASYRLDIPFMLPGTGEDIYELDYKISVFELDVENEENFQQIIKLKVETYGIGHQYPEWKEAYDNCYHDISYYVRDVQKRKEFRQLLKTKGKELDVYGLVELNKLIIRIASKAILANGKEWREYAEFLDKVLYVLKYVEYAGDIAFQVLVATFTGGMGGIAASAIKQTFITGATMVIQGKSIDSFYDKLWKDLEAMLYSTAKGRIVNTQTIEKFYKGSKYKVWAMYAVITFAIQFKRLGSIPEAAKATAYQLRDEILIRYLHGKVRQEQAKFKAKAAEKKELAAKKEISDSNGKNITKGRNDYESVKAPPDVSGYTKRSIVAIQRIANRLKVQIITRPTNAAAKMLLKKGLAIPKKQFVKNKTINDLDTYLGASKKNIGKVGTFEPKLNRAQLKKLSIEQVKEIVKRYKQRRREWKNQAEHIKASIKKGEITVEDGLIIDGDSGLPFTGDIDVFDIRGPYGEKLSRAKYEKVVKELIKSNATNVEHGAHLWWQRWKGDSVKDIRTQEGIFDAITGGHSKGGKNSKVKENLVKFGSSPNINAKPKSIYYKGRTDVKNL